MLQFLGYLLIFFVWSVLCAIFGGLVTKYKGIKAIPLWIKVTYAIVLGGYWVVLMMFSRNAFYLTLIVAIIILVTFLLKAKIENKRLLKNGYNQNNPNGGSGVNYNNQNQGNPNNNTF